MATGPAFFSLLSILRGRRKRRAGDVGQTAGHDESTARRDAALEMERRMASYLAQRDMGRGQGAAMDRDGQENGR
jgi:hypothetical protein